MLFIIMAADLSLYLQAVAQCVPDAATGNRTNEPPRGKTNVVVSEQV